MCYSVLHCVTVCCTVLQCVALCYSVLHCGAVDVAQVCLVTYLLVTLQHTATHCNTLQHTATHCNTWLRYALLQICYRSAIDAIDLLSAIDSRSIASITICYRCYRSAIDLLSICYRSAIVCVRVLYTRTQTTCTYL